MRKLLPTILIFTACASPTALAADEKITYQDNVLPVFRNACLNCHNADKKKAGLDLSSYGALMAGSNSGKVIEPGDPDGSLLFRLVTHTEEPAMPPKGDKLSDRELESIKKWIVGGVLETSGSTAIASSKPKVDLKIDAGAGKPDGPPPMPGELLLEPPVHTRRAGAVLAMASSPWAPLVAVGGQKQVLLYNPQSRDLLGVIPFPDGFPNVLKFSRSGKLLLVAGGVGAKSGKAVLFDVATGSRVTEVGDELDAILAADISPDQSLVAIGDSSKVVKIYATASGAMVGKIKKHTDWVTAVAFSPDGVLLATGDRNGGLFVWEADSANEFYNLPGHKSAVTDAAFRGDSNALATSGEDGDLKLWDMTSGKQSRSFPAHPGGALSVDFAPDGKLVSAGRDNRVKSWKADGSPIKTYEPFGDIALHAAFDNSDGGKLVIGADYRGEIRVFPLEVDKPAGNLDPNPPPIAEQLAAASAKLAEMQAASEKTTAEFAAAQEKLAEATSQMNETKASLPQLRKAVEEAESDVAEAAKTRDQCKAAHGAATLDVTTKRREADRLLSVAKEKQNVLGGVPSWQDLLGDDVSARQAACSNANVAAAAAKEAAELAPADMNLAKAAAEAKARADEARAALEESQRTYGESSRLVGALDGVFLQAVASADDARRRADAAVQNANASRTAFDLASDNAAAASESLADAREAVQTAEANLKAAAGRIETLSASVERLKPTVEKVAAEVAPVKQQVARLTAGQFFTQVYFARQALRAAQLESDAAAAGAQAAQAAAEKAVADVPAFEKRMREFDEAISAAERQVPIAQQTATAAANMAKAMDQLAADRDAFVKQSFDHAAKIAEMSALDPENKVLVEAAEAAKSVGELLASDLEKFRQRVKDRHKLAKEIQDASAATVAAVDREKLAQKNAPQTLESLKSAIPAAQTLAAEKKAAAEAAAQKLKDAKARSDRLDVQYADLKKQLGLFIQS